jgi:hypothetical protein
VIYLDRVLLEVEEVREERAPHMLDNLVVTSSTPVYYGGPPENAVFYLFIHPGTAFTASHVMPPFDPISDILPEKNTDGCKKTLTLQYK